MCNINLQLKNTHSLDGTCKISKRAYLGISWPSYFAIFSIRGFYKTGIFGNSATLPKGRPNSRRGWLPPPPQFWLINTTLACQ